MQNTKLIQLLQTLTSPELKSFEKFIHSPFHSQKRDVTKYFALIKKHYPKFDSPAFTPEKLFKNLYPGEKYSEERMRANNSFLYKMAKEFLIHSGLNENDFYKDILLLEQYKKRELNSSFESLSGTMDNGLKSSVYSLDDYFIYRQIYLKKVYNYNLENVNVSGIESGIGKRIEAKTGAFLTGYLRALMEEIVLGFDYGPNLQSPVMEKMKLSFDVEKFFSESSEMNDDVRKIKPLYYLYKTLLTLTEDGKLDEASFEKAKSLFLDNIRGYSRAEKFLMFEDLLNIYFVNTNYSNRNLIEEEFDLIKLQLKHEAFTPSEDTNLKPMQFRNILYMGLDIKNYEWTEKFIMDYSKYLPRAQRKNILYYSTALLEYRRGNADKALENSVKVKYDNFIFKRDLKVILLRLFFEQGLYEQARYFLDTSKKYTRTTDKLSEQMKELDKNFMSYYGMLLNMKEKPDSEPIGLLMQKLEDEKVISNKAWLIREFEKLQ
jgi:hypothetical protein